MAERAPWVGEHNLALLTDLYQLTMAQAYLEEGMTERAVFSLHVRALPRTRNYVLACGTQAVLPLLEELRFSEGAIAYLGSLERFSERFLDWLRGFRFSGDVYAVLEGTPVFAEEPLLEVEAPLAEAQLVETLIMNQVHLQSALASKAARLVEAARGRPVVDFGLRRMHGADAGLKGARAFHVAGLAASSNLLAGWVYGVPVTGTMGHSYIQAHEDEREALRAFVRLYPDAVLLVDTYDTLRGVERVIALVRELGPGARVRGIRLDSGDLGALARRARQMLDAAGLRHLQIFASGGLDEYEIARLLEAGAPIDGFGVGSRLAVAEDAPAFDMAYKLTQYAGRGRLKTAPGKRILPGRKQVFRREEGGRALGDVIARAEERLPGRPLLHKVMEGGRVLEAGREDLEAARARARRELQALPERVRALEPAEPPYPVALSAALEQHLEEVRARVV
ncbi:MAG: nicotinate phosphoribosyltransferase [Planctomycetota bacterium]|nr:MAG: nicotinate phosphoribosyltransferase [Planctomycetota bacterium]